MNVSVILLAGGKGTRMQTNIPKQFLSLKGFPVVIHSLKTLREHPWIQEIIVVCDKEYFSYFDNFPVTFASPGKERQDSVHNGFQQCSKNADLICIHDGARPFIEDAPLNELFCEGKKWGAAALGTPVKATIKETCNQLVSKTLDRSILWEIQTPQVITPHLLQEGFEKFGNTKVTDDVSFVELLGCPVKLVKGSYRNLKITTHEDLVMARAL